ncbi:MAG: phophatidylinositol-4-phosphate 5-kinase [Flaviaesturariibacter sp.]|nr:phophatidylinositol-4-phosphate 5-kinase [Flaviaesturariibacter sp.]
MRNAVLGFVLLLCARPASSQLPAALNSGLVISQAIQLHDKEEYKKAIQLFRTIPRNDTNYVRALYEMSMSYNYDSNYNAALAACDEGLKRENSPYELDLMVSKASTLDDMGRGPEAVVFYDLALAKYPASQVLLLNKSIALMRQQKLAEAETILKQLVITNPYYASAHMKLASIAISQGRPVPAMFSLLTYLIISPGGRHQSTAIKSLSAICKNDESISDAVEKRSVPEETFGRAEQVILSKIALDKSYKQQASLDDPIIRQLQALMEVVKYDPSSTDFYMQYYVPLYKQVFEEGHFEASVFQAFSQINIEQIQKYMKKNAKDVKEAQSVIVSYLNQIRATRLLPFTTRKTAPAQYHFDNDNTLIGKGTIDAADNQSGNWEFYHENGNVKARGMYTPDGKKTGEWIFFYDNGDRSGIEHWTNGVENGEDIVYFHNGMVSTRSTYVNGKINGEQVMNYLTGQHKSTTTYRDDVENGPYRESYSSGRKHVEATMSDGKLNGPYSAWYANGRLSKRCTYASGELTGLFQSYFENGRLSFEATYAAGKLTGAVRSYHANGKLKEARAFVDGLGEGEDLEYDEDGVLTAKSIFKQGKLTGLASYYDHDGKLYSTLLFDKDICREATYLDKEGKVTHTSVRKGKTIDLTTYSPEGIRKSSAVYNENGNVHGTRTFYYASGNVQEVNDYVDGKLQGKCIGYYNDGTKQYEISYEDGEKNGPAAYYHPNGKLKSAGFYLEDEQNGDWTTYYLNGAIEERYTYRNGDYAGYYEYYHGNGKIDYELVYTGGWLTGLNQFDTSGKLLFATTFKNGNGVYESKFPNGRTRYTGAYKGGDFDGDFTLYYPDGSIRQKKAYDRGLLHGTYTDYHSNGKVAATGTMELGKRTGTWKYYSSDGKLWKDEPYIDGDVAGTVMMYHPNGKVARAIEYRNGSMHGIYKRYSEDGLLLYVQYYEEGEIRAWSYEGRDGKLLPRIALPGGTGKMTTFFANGGKAAEMEFLNGAFHGLYTIYHSNGKIAYQSTNANGLTQGHQKEFYNNGNPQSDYLLTFDVLDGLYKEYHENGKVKEEGQYVNGDEHGLITNYDETGKRIAQRRCFYGTILEIIK